MSIRQIQQILSNMRYPVGPVDGIAGSKTVAAILLFQGDHGLERTGQFDAATVALLRKLNNA